MSTQILKFENGLAKINRWEYQNIHITHTHSSFHSMSTFSASRNDEKIRLHFGLKGKYSFYHKQLNRSFERIEGLHNVMYSKGFDIQVSNKSNHIETFGIEFPKELFLKYTSSTNDLLKKFADKILNGKPVLLSKNWQNIDYPTHQIIHQIINCQYKDDIKDLFLLSKSIELLVLACEAHANYKGKSKFIHSDTDRDKLLAVKELVKDRLNNPPSLSEISKIVGINEYKLKGGFKELFGTTIFSYIRSERLKIAYQYLSDSDHPIAWISDRLGYSSPQHFSNAFKKKYKMTPLSVRNNPSITPNI